MDSRFDSWTASAANPAGLLPPPTNIACPIGRVLQTRCVNAPTLRHPKRASRVGQGEVGDHRLAGNRGLAFGGERPRAFGQIDVDARAETDHADALAGGNRLALAGKRQDAPRHEACDLLGGDTPSVRHGDDERVALVVLARLVEIGAEEFAGTIDDALDAAGDGAAVDVAIEHAHENGNARQRPLPENERFPRYRVERSADTAG